MSDCCAALIEREEEEEEEEEEDFASEFDEIESFVIDVSSF